MSTKTRILILCLIIAAVVLLLAACAESRASDPGPSQRVQLDSLIERSHSPDRAVWYPAVQELGRLADGDPALRDEIWRRARVNTLGMKFVRVEPGVFVMGPDFENPFDVQWPHPVKIARPYYIAVTEVTNAQFQQLFSNFRPDKYSRGADAPATRVMWDKAVRFCEALSTREGVVYRLPTEAEWEYACQGGSSTRYGFGSGYSNEGRDRLSEFAWWNQPQGRASDVAMLKPNHWGICDMHGNAYEWVADWYSHSYYTECLKRGIVVDPMGPEEGRAHVLRGGAWNVGNRAALTCTARMPLPVF